MKRRAALLAIAALGWGCDELTPPSRTPRYLFDLSGEVFRWPSDRMPVRFFADPRGAMPRLVANGLFAWEHQFLYGEFRAAVVTDSADADVIVVWQDSVPPDVTPDTAGAVDACTGVTILLVGGNDSLVNPIRVTVAVRAGYTAPQVAACVRRVTPHELGHSLGLLLHSPAPADLMYAPPTVETPSGRDRAAVEVLYHTAPTVGPPPR